MPRQPGLKIKYFLVIHFSQTLPIAIGFFIDYSNV